MKQIVTLIIFLLFHIAANSQAVGNRIAFKGGDGKQYTGTITEVRNNRYKIKYDGMDFNGWLTADLFKVVGNVADSTAAAMPPPVQATIWKTGDTVEVRNLYNSFKWENATVTLVYNNRYPIQYKVSLDEPAGHEVSELLLTGNYVRARGTKDTIKYTINSRVDVSNSDGTPKARGTVIKITGDKYKVHYDGCATSWDEQVFEGQLRPAAILSPNDPDIFPLTGKWALFAFGYTGTVVKVKDVTIEEPPLQIYADGTYVWYDTYNKPPVKSTWLPHAKFEGVRTGTEIINGILIKDSKGAQWKIYKNGENRIEAKKMCTEETLGGTKLK